MVIIRKRTRVRKFWLLWMRKILSQYQLPDLEQILKIDRTDKAQ